MSANMLSDQRTVLITGKTRVPIHAAADGGKLVGMADPGAVAGLKGCAVDACHIPGQEIDGWMPATGSGAWAGRKLQIVPAFCRHFPPTPISGVDGCVSPFPQWRRHETSSRNCRLLAVITVSPLAVPAYAALSPITPRSRSKSRPMRRGEGTASVRRIPSGWAPISTSTASTVPSSAISRRAMKGVPRTHSLNGQQVRITGVVQYLSWPRRGPHANLAQQTAPASAGRGRTDPCRAGICTLATPPLSAAAEHH